jgi:hemolysin-activating ACP:hemolysin acyltransferase
MMAILQSHACSLDLCGIWLPLLLLGRHRYSQKHVARLRLDSWAFISDERRDAFLSHVQQRSFAQIGQSPSRIWVSHVLSPLPYASTYNLFYEPGCTTPISTSSTSFVSKSSSTS